MRKFQSRISTFCIFLAICLLLCVGVSPMNKADAESTGGTPLLLAPFVVSVPAPPTPFRAGGKTHLVYELHITNFFIPTYFLEKGEVFGDREGKKPLLSYEGKDFDDIILHLGESSKTADNRRIEGGKRIVVFMWVTVDDKAKIPVELHHRLTFRKKGDPKGRVAVLEKPTVKIKKEAPLVISPPLRGDGWVALDAPSNNRKLSDHRFALGPFQGKPYIAQRFAIDWMKLGKNGKLFKGDYSKNKNWHCYNQKLYAVADGVVVMARDNIPENTPMSNKYIVPITQETVCGNFVVLDIGNDRYALYAHLKPGSLRVKVGDRVRRGQVIGHLGNTGNSEAPHLHFHITGPIDKFALAATGYPYEINSFVEMGRLDVSSDKMTADDIKVLSWRPKPGDKGKKRRNEMPLPCAVINFSE